MIYRIVPEIKANKRAWVLYKVEWYAETAHSPSGERKEEIGVFTSLEAARIAMRHIQGKPEEHK